ncbi:MAG: hypothetical protein WEA10_06725 [Actinomycetota bacterium]
MTTKTRDPDTIAADPSVATILEELGEVADEERRLKARRRELPMQIDQLRSSPTGLKAADDLLALQRELDEIPTRLQTVSGLREAIERRRDTAIRQAGRAVRAETAPERNAARARFWEAIDALVAAADDVGAVDADLVRRIAQPGSYGGGEVPWRSRIELSLRELRRVAGPRPQEEQ